jgi:acetyl-CoA carboxylase alpha subunit
MSLSSTDNPISKLPSKIEDVYEDVQSESIIKLKNLISSIEKGNDSSLTKDISEYSSSDVENMRRQMNRLHAKQTRLKKKNMTKEMEVVRKFACISMCL